MIGLQTTVVSEKRKLQDSMYAMKLFLLKKEKEYTHTQDLHTGLQFDAIPRENVHKRHIHLVDSGKGNCVVEVKR